MMLQFIATNWMLTYESIIVATNYSRVSLKPSYLLLSKPKSE